jgi:hypothetical protein
VIPDGIAVGLNPDFSATSIAFWGTQTPEWLSTWPSMDRYTDKTEQPILTVNEMAVTQLTSYRSGHAFTSYFHDRSTERNSSGRQTVGRMHGLHII